MRPAAAVHALAPRAALDPDEATLRTILPHVRALGITRLANQTGLDTVGLPVVAAIRPNSRSLATHQGKGATVVAAKIAAIMEAAECALAETPGLPLRLAAAAELAGAVDVASLPVLDPLGPRERILWAEGRCLLSGRAAWVPYELVHADFTDPQPAGSFHFPATTNGLGAGLTAARARQHALLELIERDALAGWRALGGPAARAARRIDLASVEHPFCRALLDRLGGLGILPAAWWVDGGTGIATVQALLVPPDDGLAGIEPELGAACHPVPAVALLGALAEAAQSRVTRIAGARDDYDTESYAPAARADRLAQARAWVGRAGRSIALARIPAPAVELEATLAALARRGCGQVVWVELSRAGLPFVCGRAVVPGLAGPFVP